MTLEEEIEEYIKSLNEMELKAYYIEKTNLESSFDLSKSLGFEKNQKKK